MSNPSTINGTAPKQAAHTPGPWTVGTNPAFPEKRFSLVRAADRVLCPAPIVNGYTEDEIVANARLIAAAPELLAIVRELVEGGGIMEPSALFEQARAALAKAEGGAK